MIFLAEALSSVTCERCGGPGKNQSKGWVYTMCDPCYKAFVDKKESVKMKNIYKVEVESGIAKWFNEAGQLHRIEGPAIEDANGTKVWFLNGVRHREGGPAIEYADGSKEWYLNGVRHREVGPAIEGADGSKGWYLNGELHREGGPAYEGANGRKLWYLNDEYHTEAEYNAEMQKRGSTCNGKIVEIDGKRYTLTEVK